jgi:hypothetical protein
MRVAVSFRDELVTAAGPRFGDVYSAYGAVELKMIECGF